MRGGLTAEEQSRGYAPARPCTHKRASADPLWGCPLYPPTPDMLSAESDVR
jgi:hypothetical protein